MKITITGSNSGVGLALTEIFSKTHDVTALTRNDLDLSNVNNVLNFEPEYADIFIHCAAHDMGGKVEFLKHDEKYIFSILTVNLVAPVLLTRKVLDKNTNCKIVFITSTNILNYWPNDLAYSLSKSSLHEFNRMLKIEYEHVDTLEVILGLTKTNFNNNRHKPNHKLQDDLYANKHLDAHSVATKIVAAISDNNIKTLEIKA